MSPDRLRLIVESLTDALALAGLSLGVPAALAALVSWDAFFLRFLFTPAAIGVMTFIAAASFVVILRGRATAPEHARLVGARATSKPARKEH